MNSLVRDFRDFFVSLKLTVVLLVLGMLLVFAATLDQTNLGIWGIQQKWFRSFFVLQDVGGIPVPVFPGGYLIGGLLFINLISAHIYRFKFAGRKTGIFLTHLGLILLLVGELLSGLWQEDFQMRLEEGQTKNYSESYRLIELAIVDTTDPNFDDVVAIPEAILARGEPVQNPKLPFRVVTKLYYPNSEAQPRAQVSNPPPPLADQGALAARFVFSPAAITYKENDRNIPVAVMELVAPEGTLGSWVVTTDVPVLRTIDGVQKLGLAEPSPQKFSYAGHTWTIALRAQRAYRPFSLTLLQFHNDVYAGTDIPKNYSSRIRLTTPDGRDDRDVLIYMNNPLRYAGLTFYQASFEKGNDHVTILQVVRNPSWLLPYVSCALMALGLVVQFGIHLVAFIRKRRALAPAVA